MRDRIVHIGAACAVAVVGVLAAFNVITIDQAAAITSAIGGIVAAYHTDNSAAVEAKTEPEPGNSITTPEG
jgi:hypothetical protein